ncbi:hypothetical protein GW17_00049502 [Ensete ventricosum]|nr:hypothetical protein GW17_00049502 [Ensete ventricosum]RZS12807.1 hypothetical protein BHM03_00044308 [Ensete ventricosum]
MAALSVINDDSYRLAKEEEGSRKQGKQQLRREQQQRRREWLTASKNRYYGSLGGSKGDSQELAVMIPIAAAKEGMVVVEQRVANGVDQRPQLEAMDIDGKE